MPLEGFLIGHMISKFLHLKVQEEKQFQTVGASIRCHTAYLFYSGTTTNTFKEEGNVTVAAVASILITHLSKY